MNDGFTSHQGEDVRDAETPSVFMREADVLISMVSIHRTGVGKSGLGALDNGAPTIGKCERKVGGVSERRESVMLNHV
jgi:hypothetical protein